MQIHGNVIAGGIAMGKIYFPRTDYSKHLKAYRASRSDIEKIRFSNAVAQAKQDLNELIASENHDSDSFDILKSHMSIVSDATLENKVFALIDQGISAPYALTSTIDVLSNSFQATTDPLFKERVADIRDAGNRILRKLLAIEEPIFPDENIIVIADDIEPSVMASYSEEYVKAVCLSNPSETSHSAIIAKSKDFITITNFDYRKYPFKEDDIVMIDTENNNIIINPSTSDEMEYNKKKTEWNASRNTMLQSAYLPALSLDGTEFTVGANISSYTEISKALSYGCSGIGLFRSEFLFMKSKKLPSEDEQYLAYKAVVEKTGDSLTLIRTLDIGGDKKCSSIKLPEEENPALGFRGIRVSLESKDIFKTQLRAILRASKHGKVAIMLPMVTTLFEVNQAKKCLQECMTQLDLKGIPYDKDIMLGIMVETPAACIMADVFAKHVDFFSIGTNDLIQYTFAADRTNPSVSHFFDYYEPAVIHSIHRIVTAAQNAGIWVGICGEMASEPTLIPFFMALGVDELSMAPSAIPKIKALIRTTSTDSCDLDKLLSFDSTKKVQKYLNDLLK